MADTPSSKPEQNGIQIKSDTSDPKVQKANEDSKWFKFDFFGSKPEIVKKDGEPAVPPGAITSTPQTSSPPSPSPPKNETKSIIQYVKNTVELKVYLMIFFTHLEDGKTTKEKKVYLHSNHVHEISIMRSQTWGTSGLNCKISNHEEYYVSDSLNAEPYKVPFWELFQMGNIVDVVVSTNVKYQEWESDAKEDGAKVERKTFLLQRGAISGFNATVNGSGNSIIGLSIETIDIYSNRTKVYVTSASPKIEMKGKTDAEAREARKKQMEEQLKAINSNKKLNVNYRAKRKKQIQEQLTQLKLTDERIPKSSLMEYIGRISNILNHIGSSEHSKESIRGKLALQTIYAYVASSFRITDEKSGKKIFRKFYKDYQLMGYIDYPNNKPPKAPDVLEKSLVGIVAGDDDFLFTSQYGAKQNLFTEIVDLFKASHPREFTFSEIIPKIGLPFIHEVYYDPFVELDYTKEYLFDSKFNQIPVYSDADVTKHEFEEITKPSFVFRQKPFTAMFTYDDKTHQVTMGSNGGIHVYELSLESIININIDSKMSNIKTALFFGKVFTFTDGARYDALDTIVFGSNIFSLENNSLVTNIKNLVTTKLLKIIEAVLIGSDGYYGEVNITCIFSPIRVGNLLRVPYTIDNKTVYAYGYIKSVSDNFSGSGEATTSIELIFVNSDSMNLFMGFTKEDAVGNTPTLDVESSSSKGEVSKSKTFVKSVSA